MPPIIQIVVCDWCNPVQLVFSPDQIDVYPAEGDIFETDNHSRSDVAIVDATGRLVADIGPGGSGRIEVPGAGTYQYLIASPRSATPSVLTVVAHPS
jgi:hypothetical protein